MSGSPRSNNGYSVTSPSRPTTSPAADNSYLQQQHQQQQYQQQPIYGMPLSNQPLSPPPSLHGPVAAPRGPQQLRSRAAHQLSSRAAKQPCRPATEQLSRRAAQPPSRPTAEPPSSRAALPSSRHCSYRRAPALLTRTDGLSLFDLTSGASPAPPATTDSTVRSQWATRDAAARLAVRRHLPTTERAHFSQYKSAQTLYDAVVARYSSPATAALSRLMLPHLFPDLAAFPTVADLITHLRTSDTRYRAALPAEFCAQNPPPKYITLYYIVTRLPDSLRLVRDHFLSVCPTTLTVDLLETRLLAAETSIVAVGASRGDENSAGSAVQSVHSARLQLRERFDSDFPVLRLHSDRGGEFSSSRLGACCCAQGIRQTFTLPASPQQNGIAERRIGMVMDVARTSMIHAAAPHFLWPFAVQYAAHQLNLQPRVSLPETSPTLRWTGKVGDASAFRVWGSRAFVRDLSVDKLSPRAVPCVFLGFPPDAPGWQFYHPTSRRVLSSQDVTFNESVPFYRLFPYRTAPLPPPPLFLAPGPPPVDPLPPQGPALSGLSQVDAVEPVEVAVDSGAARGAEPAGAGSGCAEPRGAESGGAEPGGVESGGAGSGGAEPGSAEPGGTGSTRVASRGTLSRLELLSPQELREWFAWRCSRAAGAGGTTVAAGSRGARTGSYGAAGAGGAAEATGVGPAGGTARATGGTGAAGAGGTVEATGVGPAGGTAGATGGTGAAGPAGTGATGAGAAGGVGAGGSAGAGPSQGVGVGAVGARGAAGVGASAGGTGAVPAGSGDATRPRPYFIPLLEQVLGLPPSPGSTPPLACPQPVPSQLQLQPASPLPAPSPYNGPTGGLAERREPTSRPASPIRAARTSRRALRPRPPAVPGTHQMALRPSTAPLRVPLPSPPESSLPFLADPVSDFFRAASPTVTRLLATVVTDPSFESTAASALVAELVDFAAHCRLDYATSLVAESAFVCPPSVEGGCALSMDVLEDRQEEFQCFAAALPHLSAMDADMASWKSAGTYVDEVPPPGANIVSGMWIFRVKRPPGSPPVFKARYMARGFSQRQGVDYFQTFSPTPKMTTLRVLLHVAAQRDYELHSLEFSTAFLQGSLHEEIWLRRPPGFTGSFPPGAQWSLRRPVYGLRQAPHEWHDTLRTTLAALGFAPSTADPSLFLCTDTSLPPFYILVYVDDLVFATVDTAGLTHVKSEL
ncbi:unnamed protein product [Closterium sp. NIES-54]